MPNVCVPDCGWNPVLRESFTNLESFELTDVAGVSLKGLTNIRVHLSAEESNITIHDFNDMDNGKIYMLVADNGASTKNAIEFPAGTTLYNGTITPENGMTVCYKFWTDGHSIFVDRAVYK